MAQPDARRQQHQDRSLITSTTRKKRRGQYTVLRKHPGHVARSSVVSGCFLDNRLIRQGTVKQGPQSSHIKFARLFDGGNTQLSASTQDTMGQVERYTAKCCRVIVHALRRGLETVGFFDNIFSFHSQWCTLLAYVRAHTAACDKQTASEGYVSKLEISTMGCSTPYQTSYSVCL